MRKFILILIGLYCYFATVAEAADLPVQQVSLNALLAEVSTQIQDVPSAEGMPSVEYAQSAPSVEDIIVQEGEIISGPGDVTYQLGGAGGGGCGQPCTWWVRGEYLLWWTDGMATPPLVSTSPTGTPQASAGVIGQGATVLFGGDLLDGERSGGRIRFGTWLDAGRRFGLEGEYLGLGEINDNFSGNSSGVPILARPFINATNSQQDAQLVALSNLVGGSVTVDASGTFDSAGARLIWNLTCCSAADVLPSDARLDLLLGYRYLRLDESLRVREVLASQLVNDPGSFDIQDSFSTRNDFHGAEIGLQRTERYRRWSLDVLAKLAFGNVRQQVAISGSTIVDDGTGAQTFNGGLLAQRTNIGQYTRNRLALVPELGVTVGYDLTTRWRATAGYSLIYWDRVVRPGDQIDDVNPNLLPPEAVPFSGPLRPQFSFREDSFWAHGMSFGLTYVY